MPFSRLGDIPCVRNDNAPTIPFQASNYHSRAMSYRLRKKSPAREVHRVAREELEGTLKELLTVNDQARSTAVHEARKHLKKVRALIRLLRWATGEASYKTE